MPEAAEGWIPGLHPQDPAGRAEGSGLSPYLNEKRGNKLWAGGRRGLLDLTPDGISWEVNQGSYAARNSAKCPRLKIKELRVLIYLPH